MDLLWRNLSTSPWFEIALLKHAELNEASNPQVAREDYDVLRKRVENAPYFQGNAERAAVFRTALLGAVGRGIDRLHLQSVRDGLSRYQARYHQFPESLVKLAIFNYVDMGDIYDSDEPALPIYPDGYPVRAHHFLSALRSGVAARRTLLRHLTENQRHDPRGR